MSRTDKGDSGECLALRECVRPFGGLGEFEVVPATTERIECRECVNEDLWGNKFGCEMLILI